MREAGTKQMMGNFSTYETQTWKYTSDTSVSNLDFLVDFLLLLLRHILVTD